LTDRAHKMTQDSAMVVFKRWRAMRKIKGFAAPKTTASQIDRAPIIMVAVDLSPDMEPLAAQLLRSVQRMLVIQPDARVACVNVIKTAILGIDQPVDDEGNNRHIIRLVALKAWAEGIELNDDRLTYSVLEGSDAAAAIIDYAEANRVDHIMMGARGSSSARRFLGSVSAKVVAEAPCSVTVIRLRETDAA
jgi:non-specific serine/threonine protein kinase/protein-serine/threonine kinase